jgi:hypothetical protein
MFEDFFKTGKKDMFVAPSTDMQLYGPAYLFKNNGSSFSRTTINLGANVWAQGATAASLNKDGWKDVILTDYGPNTTLLMNNRVDGFKVYQQTINDANGQRALRWGGSSIAVNDYLGNGKTQLVVTDNGCEASGCSSATNIHMYSWNIGATGTPTADKLVFTFEKNLPKSTLPHAYLAINKDFDASGKNSLIVFSRPNDYSKSSAIQFLKNNGLGDFTDVTKSMLVGYNTNTAPSYKPQFIDLGNGQESMIVSGGDFSGANNSTQILVKQSASGPYVAAFQNLISDFAKQVNQIQGSSNAGNQVNIVKDASNNVYLVSSVSYRDGSGNMQQSVYLSPLGGQVSGATAQAALNKMQATWPYMTGVQANTLLAQTSATYMTSAGEGKILDLNKLMSPIGGLNFNTQGFGPQSVRGFISGVQLANPNAVAMDSWGRSFNINLGATNYIGPNSFDINSNHIDQYNLTSHSEYLINGPSMTYETPLGPFRIGAENRMQQFSGINFARTNSDPILNTTNNVLVPQQYTIGLPRMYRNGNFSTGGQYTSLNTSPWFAFNGAWGNINNSGTYEHTFNYQSNGFTHRTALTYTSTNIQSGLISNVTPIVGAWAESGYRYADYGTLGDMGLYVGIKPVVLSGSLTANIPTGVDAFGNNTYTQTKMGVMSSVTPYFRALYSNNISKSTMYRISGMTTATGTWRALAELRVDLN